MVLSRLAVAVLGGLALVLGGCSGGKIHGRIINGPAGVVTVVGEKESRPDEKGVEAVTVEVRAIGRGGSGPVIGTAKTRADGKFTLSYPERRMVRDRLQLVAKAEGYIPVQEQFYLPSKGGLVLVIMKQGQTPSASAAETKPRE